MSGVCSAAPILCRGAYRRERHRPPSPSIHSHSTTDADFDIEDDIHDSDDDLSVDDDDCQDDSDDVYSLNCNSLALMCCVIVSNIISAPSAAAVLRRPSPRVERGGFFCRATSWSRDKITSSATKYRSNIYD